MISFPLVSAMILSLAAALSLQPDPSAIRRLFEEALQRRERQYGLSDARTAQAARDLGMFLAGQGNAADARGVLAQAVHIDEAIAGPAAAQTLADVAELAAVSAASDAEPLWRRAAGSADRALASRALAALGDLHARTGDPNGATSFYRQALAKEEAASEKDSATVALRLNALAHFVPPAEGIAMLERALAIDRRALGPRHPEAASTEANLAGMLLNAGRVDAAIRAGRDALAIFEETLGKDHPRVAQTATILGYAYEGKRDRAQAEKMFRRALQIDERAYGSRHPQTESDRRALAEFLAGK
jgi:tetratricopeptide (TPR) repeat protein